MLYGLNTATYKIVLGKSLIDFTRKGASEVSWWELSKSFLDNYIERLSKENAMPQQTSPTRLTVMERIVSGLKYNKLTYEEAVDRVGREAFKDVIPRFHSIGSNRELAQDMFYEYKAGRELILKDSLFDVGEADITSIYEELDARWGLLEGAFLINRTQANLDNDLRDTYLKRGSERTNITKNIPFLRGYQADTSFYCGEELTKEDIHVDHVLPRQVVKHDEIWNLVLTHSYCNESKGDKLIGKYYIEKLIARNENIMGSNHPWKQKVESMLGRTAQVRRVGLEYHYDLVNSILGAYYWGGVENYTPEKDSFYRKLITRLNNG